MTYKAMPITAYTSFLGFVVMLGSYLIVIQRIKASPAVASVQLRYLHKFFLNMGLFCLIISLPAVFLVLSPDRFPIMMAWGYVISHIFFYIAVTYIARLSFSMIPKLASKDRYLMYLGLVVCVGVTVVSIVTMPFGVMPSYNEAAHLIELNAAPVVGISIAVYAAATMLPTTILMIVNGVRNPNARTRSFLLGGGLFVLMVAGPLHDTARTASLYATADLVSAFSLLLVAAGVIYRFNERTAWSASRQVSSERM